jgi:pimeloyl-ACP methyl ester carboxylesterase
MQTVTSKDGTKIAFDKIGSGPAVIFVNGAIAYRAMDPTLGQIADLLSEHFTVYNYDRRGRGESGNTQPFTKEREIEDVQALIEAAGGSAIVFGFSSGGVVALDAAALIPGITKIGVYEPAIIVDDSRQPVPADYAAHLLTLSVENKRDEAVEYFMIHAVGVPAEYIGGMKADSSWAGMAEVAHTIAYDAAFVGSIMQGKPLPTDRWDKVTVPALVVDGSASDAWVHNAADALAQVLPNASRQTLEGQTHSVDANVIAPLMLDFFKS